MEKDDFELIRAYLSGSEEAFDTLFRRYRQVLFGYLRGMLPPADAEDVFQKTWMRVCKALPGYRDNGKFPAWLLRIGRNQALDLLRYRKRLQEVPEAEGVGGSAEPGYDPWRQVQEAELLRQLDRALEELSPAQRAVFQMRREEISFRVIADEQRCTVNTAIQRMRYAVRHLSRLLNGDLSEDAGTRE